MSEVVAVIDVWSPDGLIALGRHLERYGITTRLRVNPDGMIRPHVFHGLNSTDTITLTFWTEP